jgi:NAD(P)-dependent dehydrogenase (short-subunit alcohol dehydrogenase family)
MIPSDAVAPKLGPDEKLVRCYRFGRIRSITEGARMAGWTEANMPALGGRRALITGGTSGLGLATAMALARRGAQVLITARDPAKGEAAIARIRRAAQGYRDDAHVAALPLDLASLHSVRTLAALLIEDGQNLDLLINNAGIMGVPTRRETADGFELQIGTNHLGHFALTGLLLPLLLQAPSARIVTVASLAHRNAAINPADLSWKRDYDPFRAYNTSKLANLLFARELQRRLQAAGARAISVAAHPGLSATSIGEGGPRLAGGGVRAVITQKMATLVLRVFGQNTARGAWPILQAATDPSITGFAYLGPQQLGEMRGPSGPARLSAAAQDATLAQLLWTASVALTGVGYDGLADTAPPPGSFGH